MDKRSTQANRKLAVALTRGALIWSSELRCYGNEENVRRLLASSPFCSSGLTTSGAFSSAEAARPELTESTYCSNSWRRSATCKAKIGMLSADMACVFASNPHGAKGLSRRF